MKKSVWNLSRTMRPSRFSCAVLKSQNDLTGKLRQVIKISNLNAICAKKREGLFVRHSEVWAIAIKALRSHQ
jgi:hypothetical protein